MGGKFRSSPSSAFSRSASSRPRSTRLRERASLSAFALRSDSLSADCCWRRSRWQRAWRPPLASCSSELARDQRAKARPGGPATAGRRRGVRNRGGCPAGRRCADRVGSIAQHRGRASGRQRRAGRARVGGRWGEKGGIVVTVVGGAAGGRMWTNGVRDVGCGRRCNTAPSIAIPRSRRPRRRARARSPRHDAGRHREEWRARRAAGARQLPGRSHRPRAPVRAPRHCRRGRPLERAVRSHRRGDRDRRSRRARRRGATAAAGGGHVSRDRDFRRQHRDPGGAAAGCVSRSPAGSAAAAMLCAIAAPPRATRAWSAAARRSIAPR